MFQHTIDLDTKLRTINLEDAAELFALVDANRDSLRQWLPWLDRTQVVEDTRAFIKICLEKDAAGKGFESVILYKEKIAGVIGYHPIDFGNKTVSIGYWLGADYRKLGLVRKAAKIYVNHAFQEFKLNRDEIRCAVENHKSQSIPKALGFIEEGVLRETELLYGRFVDHKIYSMLAKDWNIQ